MARCLILLGMDERATKRLLAKTFLSSEFTVREYLRQAAAYPGDLTAEIEVHSVYTRRVREERDKEIENLRKKYNFRKINFFGEIIFSRNRNRYLKRKYWRHLSFNLMFICKK